MKETLDKTIPVFSSQRRELKNELDWLVFKKQFINNQNQNKNGKEQGTTNRSSIKS